MPATIARQGAVRPAPAMLQRLRYFLPALLIGCIYLLPDVTALLKVGSFDRYTPFSVTSPSNVTTDESFLYGAQTNTMLQQHRRADDTDTWEGRNTSFPYSILPEAAEAATAAVLAPGHPLKGLKLAQMLFHFAFPAIMAGLLMLLLGSPELPSGVAACLALIVMLVSFSARTLTGGVLQVLGQRGVPMATTLQASRNPNPNVSFVVVLLTIWLIVRACQNRSSRAFVVAGAVGGLLFYSYPFYAVAWTGACVLFALAAWIPPLRLPRCSAAMLPASAVVALPYFAWTEVSKRTGVYKLRTDRLGMVYTHDLSRAAAQHSLVLAGVLLSLTAFWLATRRQAERRPGWLATHSAVLAVLALGLAGIAGLNMQVVTGFNVQADFHYTHMVIQPAIVLIACLILAFWARQIRRVSWFGGIAFSLLLLVCAAVECGAGLAAAPFQQLHPEDAALFDWLEAHTRPGEVLATTNARIGLETPLFTHNRLLFANGTRASGTDQELLERLLLANRLTGGTEQQVRAELTSTNAIADDLRSHTDVSYLFEHSSMLIPNTNVMTEAALASALAQYRSLDLDSTFPRYRVDYVYTEAGQSLQTPSRMRAVAVLGTPGGGVLWHLSPGS